MSVLLIVISKHMTLFVGSQSFISLPSFMFVSAAVSEIHTRIEPEQEGGGGGEFQFKTFPGHIFLPEVPFEHMYAFNLLEVPYTTN